MGEPGARGPSADDVEWLRIAYHQGAGDDRPKQAGLFGLALAAFTEHLQDGEARLPGALDEALAALTEARSDRGVAAALGVGLPLATGLLRWRRLVLEPGAEPDRAMLDAVVDDLTAALGGPWQTPAAGGDLTGPQWALSAALIWRSTLDGREADRRAAGAHAIEALAAEAVAGARLGPPGRRRAAHSRAVWQRFQAGDAFRLDPSELSRAAPRLRVLLRTLPEGHQLRTLLRLGSATDVMHEALRSQRWPAAADAVLAELRAVPAGWGSSTWVAERRICRALALALGSIRLAALLQQAGSPGEMDYGELDGLCAELDALDQELPAVSDPDSGPAALGSSLQAARLVLGSALAGRAMAAPGNAPPDPGDAERSRRYLAGLPGVEREAASLATIFDVLARGADDDPGLHEQLRRLGQGAPERSDALGAGVAQVIAHARTAARSQRVEDISTALSTLRRTLRGLPIGHPARADLLAVLACLLAAHATLTSRPEDAAAALDAATTAARLAPLLGREQNAEVLDSLSLTLSGMVGHDLHTGPFEAAQSLLEAGLAAQPPAEPLRHFRWLTGLGTALALRWPTADEEQRQRTRRILAQAEQLLVETPPQPASVPSAMALFLTLAMLAVPRGDRASAAAAGRVLDWMDETLRRSPGLADQLGAWLPGSTAALVGVPGGAEGYRAMLARLRSSFAQLGPAPPAPAPPNAAEVDLRVLASLRAACEALQHREPAGLAGAVRLLTRVLAEGVPTPERREQARAALARCLAAVAGLTDGAVTPRDEEAAAALADAIRHLELVTVERADPLPTVERARLLDLLARCYRTQGRSSVAVDTTRTALGELFGAALVADGTDAGLEAAAAANPIALRAVHWCVADGEPDRALSIAEAGRSLVLSSVVLAGRARQFLSDLGRDDLATGWENGDMHAKVAGLGELTASVAGIAITAAPHPAEVAGWVFGAGRDAAVYVVPPPPGGRDGMLLVLRGPDRSVTVVPLENLDVGPGSPLDRYRSAFATALAATGSDQPGGLPFRGTPEGLVWAAALDELGLWCHRSVIGPMLQRIEGWKLSRTPSLVLIPLADLAAVPFAAAWTPDPQLPGGRRYAVHDLVLTQAASARLLFDATRREQLPLPRDIVLVTDPTGSLPAARAAARAIGRMWRSRGGAEVTAYRRSSDPADAATAENLLAALPAAGRDGASLLHLSTHGEAAIPAAESTLATTGGRLSLGAVLDQARSRPARAPGGLVICDACLTDTARVDLDESLTLATAFLTAGATAVIGTRWPTDDDAAAVLALHLHQELARGQAPAQALRLAQLAMLDPAEPVPPGAPPLLRTPQYPGFWAEPASWAGYVHHGV